MARTDAHQPWWLRATVVHNHTNGVCDYPDGPKRPEWGGFTKDSCWLKLRESCRCSYCNPERGGSGKRRRKAERSYCSKDWVKEYE